MYRKLKRISSAVATTLLFAVTANAVLVEPSLAAKARISGNPKTTVDVGDSYRFKPSVSGLRESKLKFTIKRKPSWAKFNSSNGVLKGTPSSGDVGRYRNISIRVTDGRKSATLSSFTVDVNSGSSDGSDSEPPGGGGSGDGGSGGGGGSPGSGNADNTVEVGETYIFRPKVKGLNSKKLRFSIRRQPSWLKFNSTSGRLKGTPASGDVGLYDRIVITATDGKKKARVGPFSIAVVDSGGSSGDDGSPGDNPGGDDPPGGGGNSAPTIAGSPPASVLQGSAYDFTPSANDADGDALEFSVSGLPGWANFDRETGRLYGTPTAGDVGIHGNVIISVTDGTDGASLGPFDILVEQPGTGSVTLQWTPPTRNTDGSRLRDLAAYRIDWGRANGTFTNSVTIDNPGLTSYVIENLDAGTYKFAVAAVNSSGVSSERSNVANKTVN